MCSVHILYIFYSWELTLIQAMPCFVISFQPKFKCVCDDGWMAPAGNPACISDVDECSLAQKPCSTNPPVTCYNTQGSFYCGSCPAGESRSVLTVSLSSMVLCIRSEETDVCWPKMAVMVGYLHVVARWMLLPSSKIACFDLESKCSQIQLYKSTS